MKKFKALKTIESFDDSKLSRDQMYLATGGKTVIVIIRPCTKSSSVCSEDDGNEPECPITY